MKKIFLAGAGKSATVLINYLLERAHKNRWQITIADGNEKMLAGKVKDHPAARKVVLDITNQRQRKELVSESDLVISLMPPQLHYLLAQDCLHYRKHLITSSYVSPEIRAMDEAAKAAGVMLMCEMGLDPGIDHMIASHIIHSIRRITGDIISFKSYCGGLIAPEDDDNSWHYKFCWNPRNIILAGRDGGQYLHRGKTVQIPYERLFEDTDKVPIEGLGTLASYANRDSLHYLSLYDLPEAQTFLRATLRYPDFCKGWHALVRLGLTTPNDRHETAGMTYWTWLAGKTAYTGPVEGLPEYLAHKLHVRPESKLMRMLEELDLWGNTPLRPGVMSSADILLELLQEKWKMESWEKDMVVMQHEVVYLHKKKENKLISTMVLKGEDREFSAMAKTVGLPIGILAKLLLNGQVAPLPGVQIPVMPAIYRPVLKQLEHYDIRFVDTPV